MATDAPPSTSHWLPLMVRLLTASDASSVRRPLGDPMY
jgi:hypothetical protein